MKYWRTRAAAPAGVTQGDAVRSVRADPRTNGARGARHAVVDADPYQYAHLGTSRPTGYRTADRRWVQLHTGFPHHLAGHMEVLGCAPDAERETVEEAIAGWTGQSLEDALAERLDASQLKLEGGQKGAAQDDGVAALVDQFYADVEGMGGRRWDTSSLIARLNRSD